MNPRELIARLNVPAVRYEIGRGGIPELTNIDIAGALGFVNDEFAREVFCSIWWPDGAQRSAIDLAEQVRAQLMTEYADRERAAAAAKLDLHIAEGNFALKRHRTDYDRQILQQLTSTRERAEHRRWSWNPKVYPLFFPVAIEELRHPRRCTDCAGRGTYRDEKLLRDCKRCGGTGLRHQTKTWRAEQFGMSETTFKSTWDRVYGWVFRLLFDAEARAARQISEALAREDSAA